MVTDYYTLSKSIETLRKGFGKEERLPAVWLEVFLRVAQEGEQGITTQDLIKDMDLTQGIASRMVKHMSRFYDPIKKESAGYDLLVFAPDHYYRHRQRLFLSEHGKEVAKAVLKTMQ